MLGNILPISQVAAVTALVAGVMTILFGLVANLPFAIATGLGITTLLAVTIAPMMTWPEAVGLVVIDGLVIVARRHRLPPSSPRSPSGSGRSSR